MNYQDFLQQKAIQYIPTGFDSEISDMNPMLFDWQKILVRWALYKGRAAIFADCGLGKTPMQLEWARHVAVKTNSNVLILAPLAVSQQTVREGQKFGISVNIAASHADVKPGINITNYEKLHKFDPQMFSGIVLDESSILKSFAGKYRNDIVMSFLNTPYKLACTATPSPNDYMELGNHAEFLGVMTRGEMLSMFFINDTGDTGKWRLKGHVERNIYWQWLSSWAVMMRYPSDIGFDDNGFILPELKVDEHIIKFTGPKDGLFVEFATTLTERRNARRESMQDRINITADMVNNSDKIWLVWCNLNDESALLSKAIKGAVEVKGSDSTTHKEIAMLDFQDSKIKCLVTKPRIAGFGMNWQNCSNMAFVGLSDSYEQYYQALRRCWRFGQTEAVNAHIVIGEKEGSVIKNIKRKESDMITMYSNMIKHMKDLMTSELKQARRTRTDYNPTKDMVLPEFIWEAAV